MTHSGISNPEQKAIGKATQKATIKDVARLAGVSTQTVSRVINERPDVSSETRQRILEIIAELDYRPSALARSLIQQRSNTLGVVTAGLKFIGPSRTLNGIAAESEAQGYALLLEELPRFTTAQVEPILNSLLQHQVEGIIWAVPEIGDNRGWLEERRLAIPVPAVFLAMAERPAMSSVMIDNYHGAQLATRHLLDSGRQHVAHLSGPLEWWEARERQRGWRDSLLDAGLPADLRCQAEGNWSSSSGETAFLQLLETYPEMDAVFVANDQMALAVLSAAQKRGLRIPQDLAVVGFDDIAESAYFIPPLTTIRQDQTRLGRLAVQELSASIRAARQNKAPRAQSVVLLPELIIRESA